MKIDWDKENNVISIGAAKFTEYKNFKSAVAFACHVLDANGIKTEDWFKKIVLSSTEIFAEEHVIMPKTTIRERNKQLGDALGCSISQLFKHYKGLQTKAFIVPVYPIYKSLVDYKPWKVKNGKWDEGMLSRIHQNKELLNEVYNDGLKNILPIVLKSKKSPKELKKEYGGAWKLLSKNSLNKNKAFTYKASNLKHEQQLLLARADIPTTLLNDKSCWNVDVLQYLKNNFKGYWGNAQKMAEECRLFLDTQRMAAQLEKEMNPSWSARRIKEEHDKMAAEINARKYSKDKFDSTSKIAVKYLEQDGYVATLLESAFDIADEGTSMGHCVGLYAEYVREGNYLVYSVTKNGVRSSTIGINNIENKVTKDSSWKLEQQYGRFNAHLKDDKEKAISDKIIKMLNKEDVNENN